MEVADILAKLKSQGKPQTAAIYQRHGSGENVFGVLTSDITRLQNKIKVNHVLAKLLWSTENAEARILSLLIADPLQVSRADAEVLVEDGPSHFLNFYVCDLLSRIPKADAVMRAWMKSKSEDRREVGYGILSARLKRDPQCIADEDALTFLRIIEREIRQSPNWARYAMNSALISIGNYKPELHAAALATAQRIGKVEVDHGETTCKTPNAVTSLAKR